MKRFWITHSKKSATKSIKEKTVYLFLSMTFLHKLKSKLQLLRVFLGKMLIKVCVY